MTLHFHIEAVHIHSDANGSAIVDELKKYIKQQIDQQTGEIKVALNETKQEIIAAFDAETNRIAAKLQELIDNPPTDDAEFNSALRAQILKLQGVGAGGSVPPPVDPNAPPQP